jgi:hypothetical protein
VIRGDKMVKFKTKNLWNTIQKVEIERETDSYVWINGYRSRKKSEYECFFDTFIEAKEFLIKKAEMSVDSCQINFSEAISRLHKTKSMTCDDTLDEKNKS